MTTADSGLARLMLEKLAKLEPRIPTTGPLRDQLEEHVTRLARIFLSELERFGPDAQHAYSTGELEFLSPFDGVLPDPFAKLNAVSRLLVESGALQDPLHLQASLFHALNAAFDSVAGRMVTRAV